MDCKQKYQLEESDLYSLLTFQCLEKESYFWSYTFSKLSGRSEISTGLQTYLEARGPPTDFVDLDQGHRETAILSACIRRQLPFVGNVWIFRGLYCTESSKILLCIKLLQRLKLSYKILIKKKISKFHMAPRCSSTWSPVSPFPLTRKRKKGSERYPSLLPSWYYCIQCCRQRLELPAQYGPKSAFPLYSVYRYFQEICSRQVEKRSNLLGFPIY